MSQNLIIKVDHQQFNKMAKKQKDQQKVQKKPTSQIPALNNGLNPNPQAKNLRQRQLTEFIANPKPQQQKNIKKNLSVQIESVRKQSVNQEKQKIAIPSKLKKKISKKKKGKSKSYQAGGTGGVKLQRGYKFCQNCQTVLNIHKYVCTQCGFVHNMKKHKFDVMKNLSKGTPKIVKSIIQANEFNRIKLIPSACNLLFPCSFGVQSYNSKEKLPQLQLKKSEQVELKRSKSENIGVHKLQMTRGKSQSGLKLNQPVSKQINGQEKFREKIKFESLSITEIDQFINSKKLENTQKKYNKTRQQFSIYQSMYPITVMEPINVYKSLQSFQNSCQYLLFGQLVSKKEVFNDDNEFLNRFGTNNMDQVQSINSQSQEASENIDFQEKHNNGNKDIKDETSNRKVDERVLLKKMRQSNALTQKAFGLQKFHRIGALYEGETIINIIKVSQNPSLTSTSQRQKNQIITEVIPDKPKRRSSGRLSKLDTHKEGSQNFQQLASSGENYTHKQNQYEVVKIGLKQHVEMIKSLKNKVAILTGKKAILLMNLNVSGQELVHCQFGQTRSVHGNMLWLSSVDFNSQNTEVIIPNKNQLNPKNHLNKISLSHSDVPSSSDDQFLVIEWLKLYSQYRSNTGNNQDDVSYLATGTLYGHIVVYSILSDNSFATYRTIVGAHFELINCIKECPLNVGGTALFASASFDGSVKVWDLLHKSTICEFQVSNRKIQQIHWDSGAKFLIIVRDQGLQNCYIACFYSVNNRVQLPIMLTDTIDFRMIRNGVLFENSCSPMIAFPLNSKLIVMLNAKNGFLKIFETQQIRKTSLKRKKSKKNYLQQIYHDYWIRFNDNKTTGKNQINNFPSHIDMLIKNKDPYQIIQMMANVNQGIYTKLGLTTVHQIQHQQMSQKALSLVQQSESLNQNQISQVFQTNMQNLRAKSSNDKTIIHKALAVPQNIQPIGIRKSLRTRKPNIQYNFIEEEQIEQQKPKQHKPTKHFNKNNSASNSEESFDDQQQISESQLSESENSFVQNKSNKPQNNKFQINSKITKSIDNKKTLRGKTRPKIQKNHRNQQKTQICPQNISKQQQQGQKQSGSNPQELLYKLFWQQTNEQSLVNQKQDYPTNRFPKFSSIVSFVYQSQGPDKSKQQEEITDAKGKKTRNTRNQQGKVGKRKQPSHKKNQFHAQQMEQQSEMQQSEQDSLKLHQELFKSSEEMNSSYQNIPKSKKGVLKKGNPKNKPQQKIQSQKPKQQLQEKVEYMTTFIAGYSGQLIKINIRIRGYQKNHQHQLQH